ncbi:MAG: hypothetical protein HY602_02210 [Parcubacteria group bacterium]|nr:hypothetical protein [Parcubacteria group bacterium]
MADIFSNPIFKNVPLRRGMLELADPSQGQLKGRVLTLCPKEYIEKGEIPAAYLIDLADLKGYKIGDVQISEEGNHLVNLGKATDEQAAMLLSYVKQQVRDQFGVQLRES